MKISFFNRNSFLKWVIPILMLIFSMPSTAQDFAEENKKVERETNKLLNQAEEELKENNFALAEANYRKAVAKRPDATTPTYNMANMYYNKEKNEIAESRLLQAAKAATSKEDKHQIMHNLGNTFMKQKKYSQAVEAYKEALRNNPKDEETRYNFALAKKMLEENPPESGGGEDDKEEDGEDENEENKDQGEKDQNDEGNPEENEGGEDKDDKDGDQEQEKEGEPDKGDEPNPEEKGEGEEQQPMPQQGQLSPEQIKSLLEAMNNEEKKVQDKINAEKAKGAKTRTDKDW